MDTLDTERLHLRRMTDDDADHLVALNADPAVMRYLAPQPLTPQTVRAELLPYYRSFHGTPFGYWAGIERASGAWLGWFVFRPSREDPVPGEIELGYRLARAAWGRGFGTEGSRELVRRGFAEHGVERVFADTMTINAGSRRIMEKVGLHLVRTWHDPYSAEIDGAELGDVRYAITRDEWVSSRA